MNVYSFLVNTFPGIVSGEGMEIPIGSKMLQNSIRGLPSSGNANRNSGLCLSEPEDVL